MGAVIYGLSVPLAYFSVYAAMACFLAVPAMFFVPEPLPKELPDQVE